MLGDSSRRFEPSFGSSQLQLMASTASSALFDRNQVIEEERDAETFHIQFDFIREKIAGLSQGLNGARNEIKQLRVELADFRRTSEIEHSQHREVAERQENSVKALHNEVEAAFRSLQAEINDRISGQESLLNEVANLERRLTGTTQEIQRETAALTVRLDVLANDISIEHDRTKNQFRDVGAALDAERRERAVQIENVRGEAQKVQRELDDSLREQAAVNSDVQDKLKLLTNSVEMTGHERAAIETSLKNTTAELLGALEKETKMRISGDNRQEKALSAAIDLLKGEMEDDVNRRKSALTTLTDNIQKLGADLEQETAERIKSDDQTVKNLVQAKETLDKECKDLKADLEQEMQDRITGDETLAKMLAQEEKQRIALHTDLSRSCDSTKQRQDEDIKNLRNACLDLKAAVDASSKDHQNSHESLGADLRNAQKMISDRILKERVEMDAQLAEAFKLAAAARNFSEKESQERCATEEKAKERHAALAMMVEQEKAHRDLHGANLENQLTNHTKNHNAEKDLRAKESAEFRALIQSVGDNFSKDFNVLRTSLEGDGRRVAASLDKHVSDLNSKISDVAAGSGSSLREFENNVRVLRQALEDEVKTRSVEGAQSASVLADITEKIQNEKVKTGKGFADLMEKLSALADAIGNESKERSEGDEGTLKRCQEALEGLKREKAEREQGDALLKSQNTSFRAEVANENSRINTEIGGLRRNLQAMDAQVGKQFEDIKHSLEVDSSRRGAAHDKLEQAHGDLRGMVEAHMSGSMENVQGLDKALQNVKKALDQETKSRLDDGEHLNVLIGALSDKVNVESVKASKFTAEISDRLKKLSDELAKETVDRTVADEMVSKRINDICALMDREKAARDQSIAATRAQVVSCEQALEKEKSARLDDLSETRRGQQKLEAVISQIAENARLSLEVEENKRIAGDERLEKKLNEAVTDISAHNTARLENAVAVDGAIKSLRQSLEQEVKTRTGEAVQTQTLFGRVDGRLEAQAKDQSRMNSDMQAGLNKIGLDLVAEAKERAAADDENQALCMVARNLIEKESRERRKHAEELAASHLELHGHVQNESNTRSLHGASLEEQLASHAKGRAAEKDERLKQNEQLHQRIGELENRVEAAMLEVGMQHDAERKRACDAQLNGDRALAALKNDFENRNLEHSKRHGANEEMLQDIRIWLQEHGDTTARDKDMLASSISQAHDMAVEVRNELADQLGELSRLVRALGEALSTEASERASGFQQEKSAREQNIATVKAAIDACRQDTTNEVDQRISEVSQLSKKVSTIENNFTQEIAALKIGLEAEGSSRAVADERLEKRANELQAAIQAQAAAAASMCNDFENSIKNVRQLLDQEVRARIDDVSKLSTSVAQAKEMIVEEANVRSQSDVNLGEKLKALDASLEDEGKMRAETRDECLKKINELNTALDHECSERIQGDGQLRSRIDGYKQELANEVEVRTTETGDLTRDMHALGRQSKQQFDDLRQFLDLEFAKRTGSLDALEKRVADNTAGIESLTRAREESMGLIEKNLKDLRQAIEHEARLRQDETHQIKSDVNRLQSTLEAESHQLQKLISDVGERAKAIGEALAAEAKERAGADNELQKLGLHTKDLLEREITERKSRDDEVERQMGEVVLELERERNEREREDGLLKGSMNAVKQEVSVEREERVAEAAATKRVLHALETKVAEQIRDLKQDLETERGERTSADTRAERQHNDLKAATDADRTKNDATMSALDVGLHALKQSLEQEKKERVAGSNETNKNLADTMTQLSHCAADLSNERADRSSEVAAIRATIQSFDKQVAVKFQDIEDSFKAEVGLRNDYNNKLEKRFTELRSAVLIAVRGATVKPK